MVQPYRMGDKRFAKDHLRQPEKASGGGLIFN